MSLPPRRVVASLALVVLLVLSCLAGDGGSQEQPLVTADLHQRAIQRGTVRVLVQVAAPHVAERQLPSRAHALAQRQQVAAVQDLVRNNLGGVVHRVVRDFRGAVPSMAIELGPDGLRALDTLRGVVTHVVEDRPRHPVLVESAARIQADQAVALGLDGRGATIVIMDTGVDGEHPFFEDGSGASRIVAEACFSSNFPAGFATSLCPGAPTAEGGTSSTAAGSGAPCDASTIDGCDHGTLVAGIAAGRGIGFNGIAPGADLVAMQIFSRLDDEAFCGGPAFTPCVGSYPSDQIAAMQYVLETLLPSRPSIAAINLSLGGEGFAIPCDGAFPLEAQLIGELRAAGVATVAAAGNDGRTGVVTAPACLGQAVSVGATTDPPAEAIASFSNRAPGLTLLAPGLTINSSAPGGGFQAFSGTSAAAPHVAGVFAIVKQAEPVATVGQVVEALQSTGRAIAGFRRVTVLDALATFPDGSPTVQFASATYSAGEGDTAGTTTIAVTRTGPAALLGGAATVLLSTRNGTAVAGTTGAADYEAVTDLLVTFGPGETSKDVPITLRGDFTIEPDETVRLTLGSPAGALLGGLSTAVLTILNDDQPGTVAFEHATYTASEDGGAATITLARSGGLSAGATARVSTVAAGSTATAKTDYTALAKKLVTFAGGATTTTLSVPLATDAVVEDDETVQLQIVGVGAGGAIGEPSAATLVIVDDDVPGTVQFGQAAWEVTEGTASAPITVTRTGGAASGVTVHYQVTPASPGTATGGGVDYTLRAGTLTFAANETSKTFTIAIVNDTRIEPGETVSLQLFDPSPGLAIGTPGEATLTIQDNDAPTFRFRAAAYSVAEGGTRRVPVVRSGGLATPVTVGYQIDGSSTATGGGQDHGLASGTVSFGAGVTTATITAPTVQDTLAEGNETLVLRLVDPSAGTVGTPDTATVTIVDNDSGGTIQFSGPAYRAAENAGVATVRVTRTGRNLASGVTVQLTTSDATATAGDYTSASQILTFAARETVKEVTIAITDDGLAEGDETLALGLHSPAGGATLGRTPDAVLTIVDDEQSLQFGSPGYVVNEASASATVTVVRIGPAVGTVKVDYASVVGSATPGADYTSVAGTLTFGPGARRRTFKVPLLGDAVFEPEESIGLLLTNPTGGAQLGPLGAATVTIVDDDPPGAIRFGAAGYTASEAGEARITVERGSGTAGAVTVHYATEAGGTATAGSDYVATSGTLTFAAKETRKTFTIPLLSDSLDEPDETVSLRLSSPTGGATLGTPDTAVLTIRDNDVAGLVAFTAAASTVRESAGLAHVKVTRSGTAAGVTVDIETADGSATASLDYLAVPRTTLAFAAGERSKTIAVEILEDAAREGHETVRLLLSNPTGGAALGPHGEALLTITDNDPGATVQFGAAGYTVAENAAGGVASLTITRTGSAVPGQGALLSTAGGGTAVAGTDFAEWSGAVAFAGGGAKATVAIPIVIDNAAITGHRTVNLQLSNPTGGLSLGVPRTAVLTILEDDASVQFSEPGHAVAEGGVATLTVTRTGGSHGPATVSYATGSGPAPGAATASADYTAGSGSVVFPPGATSRTIQVRTARDVLVEGAETFQVQLSGPTPAASVSLGSPSTATVTIADDDAPGVLHLASAAAAVNEGKTVTLTVMRSGGSTGPVTVSYATTDGGGGAGPATGGGQADAARDYTATAGTLSFPHGVRSRTIKLPTKADTASEGPETFTVSLSSPGGGATLGAPDATVVTIVDDETPRIQLARADHVVAESSGSFALTVRRIGPTRMPSTVDYALAGLTATGAGVDFAGGGGVLTFAPGVTSRTIVVPIVEDTTSEGPETFTVSLASPTGAILGAPAVGTVTITDDDIAGAVQFGHRSYAVLEGGTATISVTRTGTAGPVTVDYATASATAAAPADYEATSGTLTFHVGETVQTFTVPTASDAQAEGSELVTLTLSDPTDGLVLGSPSAVTLWILDPIP